MASIVMPMRTRVDITSIDYAIVDVDPSYHLIFLGARVALMISSYSQSVTLTN
jgi:hypothetical protein